MNEIMNVLPHRYPFLLVDGIISKEENEITAFKNVTYNEPQFQGHFPGNPIMPGVLILEGMAQTAGLLMLEPGNKKTPLFVGADKVRFKRPVRPGDRMIYSVRIVGTRFGMVTVEATVKVEDKVCATATLILGTKEE